MSCAQILYSWFRWHSARMALLGRLFHPVLRISQRLAPPSLSYSTDSCGKAALVLTRERRNKPIFFCEHHHHPDQTSRLQLLTIQLLLQNRLAWACAVSRLCLIILGDRTILEDHTSSLAVLAITSLDVESLDSSRNRLSCSCTLSWLYRTAPDLHRCRQNAHHDMHV